MSPASVVASETGGPGRGESAVDIASRVRSGSGSAETEIVRAFERIDAAQPVLNAFTQVFHDQALARARDIDKMVASGQDPGPLAGVPVAIKDNICTTIGRTTCGSRMLAEYASPFGATVVERLEAAGAVIVGKTNMDEFAMGSSGEHSFFGPTRNPHDHARVPGGSSSGSAAAVAAGLVPIALGSDTGGSIRQPAGHCGVVGMKPTYGRVSRWGLVAFASSLDQIGPFAASVGDARLALSVICGHDARDATSHEQAAWIDGDASGDRSWRVAVPGMARDAGNHPAVLAALDRTIAALRGLGAEVIDADLPTAGHGIAAYYIVATAEASSNLARFDGIRYGHRAELAKGEGIEDLYVRTRTEGFGDEVKRRLMLGTHVLSSGYHDAYYTTALRARRLIKSDYDALFDADAGPGVDAVLLPATAAPAFRLGEKLDDPLSMYLEDLYTVGANLAGLPGVTIPAGMAEQGGSRLPVGMQLIGDAFADERLIRLACTLEHALSPGGPPAV